MPFGRGIEEPRAVIHWPSDITTVMSVAGFAEVLASNTESAGQRIRLASVPGLAILKLVAWSDRGTTTDKDAVGFSRLLSTYEHVETICTSRTLPLSRQTTSSPTQPRPGCQVLTCEHPKRPRTLLTSFVHVDVLGIAPSARESSL